VRERAQRNRQVSLTPKRHRYPILAVSSRIWLASLAPNFYLGISTTLASIARSSTAGAGLHFIALASCERQVNSTNSTS
jgi:hypothetical protein